MKKKVFTKLFVFKLLVLTKKNNNKNYIYLLKTFNIILNLNNLLCYISKKIKLQNNWIISYWKLGMISNFQSFRWKLKKKKKFNIPSLFINFSNKLNLNKEFIKKNIPVINLFKIKDNNLYDYFFKEKKIINQDLLFFFLNLISYLKKKNV